MRTPRAGRCRILFLPIRQFRSSSLPLSYAAKASPAVRRMRGAPPRPLNLDSLRDRIPKGLFTQAYADKVLDVAPQLAEDIVQRFLKIMAEPNLTSSVDYLANLTVKGTQAALSAVLSKLIQ